MAPMRKVSPPADLDHLFRHGDRAGSAAGIELDFSISINPYGPPLRVVEALRDALQSGLPFRRYPDPDCRLLSERLAKYHGLSPAHFLIGNGANDLIYATARALKPRRAAIVEPTYTEYLRASLLAGAEVSHFLPDNGDFLPAPFEPEGADLIWLGNPNNPTGLLWPPGLLEKWIKREPATLFVVDEAFLPFRVDEAANTLISSVTRLANLIVLRSLTKIYALPGLRLGYAAANPDLLARLRKEVTPWSVNTLAQVAGLAAIQDDEFLRASRFAVREALRPFAAGLAACSSCLGPVPAFSNFLLVRLKDVTSGWLCRRLAERGIAIRDASNFVGLDEQYVRISLRKPEDNERLLSELRQLFLEA
jgi:threonine-phosphate decarboxylase